MVRTRASAATSAALQARRRTRPGEVPQVHSMTTRRAGQPQDEISETGDGKELGVDEEMKKKITSR